MTAKSDNQIHEECMQRFIDFANALKDEGTEPRVVSAAMMTASAVYATYVFAGNEGSLAPSGIAKLVEAYQQQLERVQHVKVPGKKEG